MCIAQSSYSVIHAISLEHELHTASLEAAEKTVSFSEVLHVCLNPALSVHQYFCSAG